MAKSTVPKPVDRASGRQLSAQCESAQLHVLPHEGRECINIRKKQTQVNRSLVFPTLQAVQGLEYLPRTDEVPHAEGGGA